MSKKCPSRRSKIIWNEWRRMIERMLYLFQLIVSSKYIYDDFGMIVQIYVLTAHHKSKNVTFKRCVSLVVGENIAYIQIETFFPFRLLCFYQFTKCSLCLEQTQMEISPESTKMMSEFYFSKQKNPLLYEAIRY